MKTIRCQGTPFELGRAHGVGAAELIRGSVAFYEKMFAYTCRLTWESVRTIAKGWESQIATKWPKYHREIEGIADGAQLPLIDILSLNIRTELAFGMFADGCTSLYWKTSKDSFLAQNWDWMEEQKQHLILLDITNDDGVRIKMITEAGIVGKIGLNQHGVGVCLNAIKVPGCDQSRLPVHLALRAVLESTSADAAVQQLKNTGLAASAHILIADQEKAISVESTATTLRIIEMGTRDRIFHANHLLLAHEGVVDAVWIPDSIPRQQRIEQLASDLASAEKRAGSFEPNSRDIIGLLDDHEGFPYSICRFEKGPLGMDATLFSIVMELRGKKATVSLGRPCHVEEAIELGFEE